MSDETITIDDLDLPMSNIVRVLKESLPEGTLVQKEARLALAKACTVFISYIASASNDAARIAGHRTILATDVLNTFKDFDMEEYYEPLQNELVAYQQLMKAKKEAKLKKDQNQENKNKDKNENENDDDGDDDGEDIDEEDGKEQVGDDDFSDTENEESASEIGTTDNENTGSSGNAALESSKPHDVSSDVDIVDTNDNASVKEGDNGDHGGDLATKKRKV